MVLLVCVCAFLTPAGNDLLAEGAEVIADFLMSNRCSLSELGLMGPSHVCMGCVCVCVCLCVCVCALRVCSRSAGNGIENAGAIEIARALERNPQSLRSLDLHGTAPSVLCL